MDQCPPPRRSGRGPIARGGWGRPGSAVDERHNEALSESWRPSAPTLPVRFDVPTAHEIWDAASLNGRYPISNADAFAAGGPEFRSVEKLDLDWIG